MRLPGAEDTIAAIATPTGPGAIAVVRMSGPRALEIGERLLTPWRAEPRRAYRAALRHPETGEIVERPVVTVWAGPASYTGEDAIEFSVHGGAVSPAVTLAALLAAGARQAVPGEFTRRAVAYGKLDILQAEAIADVVTARSRAMHSAAQSQLDGGLSRRIGELRDAILDVEALIAYDIDFPDEDEGPVDTRRVEQAVQRARAALGSLLETAGTGEMLRTGAVVVIAGAPNTGKSSLFNALVGDARAIVTEIPGTTRDAIEVLIDVGQWPIRLIDTAGMRKTADVVERLGIEASERWLSRADLVLACGDSRSALAAAVERVGELVPVEVPIVPVWTKGDVGGPPPDFKIAREAAVSATGSAPVGAKTPAHGPPVGDITTPGVAPVTISAHTGAGLATLTDRIQLHLRDRHGAAEFDAPLLTRERHVRAVRTARDELDAFRAARHDAAIPATIAAVHLRAATHALESMIGIVDVEDVLDRVFRTFCVGK